MGVGDAVLSGGRLLGGGRRGRGGRRGEIPRFGAELDAAAAALPGARLVGAAAPLDADLHSGLVPLAAPAAGQPQTQHQDYHPLRDSHDPPLFRTSSV